MNYVRCKVSRGFFDTEFYVVVGDTSAYVHDKNVRVQPRPALNEEVDGFVLAYLVAEQGEKALVELPGEAVIGGLRTWVAKSDLEPAAAVA